MSYLNIPCTVCNINKGDAILTEGNTIQLHVLLKIVFVVPLCCNTSDSLGALKLDLLVEEEHMLTIFIFRTGLRKGPL